MRAAVICIFRFSVALLPLTLSLTVSGCGVIYSYINNEDKLDERLSVPMTREQVLEQLGKPDKVLRDDGRQLTWEYRLYSRYHWVKELLACPILAWVGGCIIYPAFGIGNIHDPQNVHSSWVVLYDNQLCMWGNPDVVSTRKVCKEASASQGRGRDMAKDSSDVFVLPVYMPPLLKVPIHRLAVLPLSDTSGHSVTTWLDLTLNFLRSRHPDLVLVERDLRPIFAEVLLQHSGRVDDESSVRVGQLTGADSLLTYRIDPLPPDTIRSTASHGGTVSGSVEFRLLAVERGTVPFRQQVLATVNLADPGERRFWPDETVRLAHRVAVNEAASYALAALVVAFGDNPLGFVPDTTASERVKVFGVLDGGPAQLAGLKKGDRILAVNGQQITTWTSVTPLSLPAVLTVERAGERREISVGRP